MRNFHKVNVLMQIGFRLNEIVENLEKWVSSLWTTPFISFFQKSIDENFPIFFSVRKYPNRKFSIHYCVVILLDGWAVTFQVLLLSKNL